MPEQFYLSHNDNIVLNTVITNCTALPSWHKAGNYSFHTHGVLTPASKSQEQIFQNWHNLRRLIIVKFESSKQQPSLNKKEIRRFHQLHIANDKLSRLHLIKVIIYELLLHNHINAGQRFFLRAIKYFSLEFNHLDKRYPHVHQAKLL